MTTRCKTYLIGGSWRPYSCCTMFSILSESWSRSLS